VAVRLSKLREVGVLAGVVALGIYNEQGS